MLSRFSLFGGRRQGRPYRRKGASVRTFVDVYSTRAWVLLVMFLILNLLDAHFTLIYLQRGGSEGNPVAQKLLDAGIFWFISGKNLGIGLGAVLFCLLKNFPNARLGLTLVLIFYQFLFLYHLALYFSLLPNLVEA